MLAALEVIVTSVKEALEAEAGGADRLELVRDLASGGLTPERDLIEAVLNAVSIPVRVMLRESAGMSIGSPRELEILTRRAAALSRLPVDGLVVGFNKRRAVDTETLKVITDAAPGTRFTFHRAFDELEDPLGGISVIKRFEQIDRILTVGGDGEWSVRKERLIAWQQAAEPGMTILVGVGLCREVLLDVQATPQLREVHVGRAARVPAEVTGQVERAAVRAVRSVLR